MPILSGTSFSFAPDDLYWPSTMIPAWDTPAYSFHFRAPAIPARANFDKHHFFDNGEDFKREFEPLQLQLPDGATVNLGDNRLNFRRLFPLRSVPGHNHYYLIPWLTVPFEPVGTAFAPTATRGGSRTAAATIDLVVEPFSIFETAIGTEARRMIVAAALTLPKPVLTLSTSHNTVAATWAGSGAAIDEDKCIASQKITVQVQPTTAADPYPEQVFVDIKRGTAVVGRLCLLFQAAISQKLVVFDAAYVSPSKLTLTMLDPVTKPTISALAQTCLDDLRAVFSKAGIDFALATPTLSWTSQSVVKTCSLNVAVDISPISGGFDDPNKLPRRIVLSILNRFVGQLALADQAEYVFVCLAPWGFVANSKGGKTGGISATGRRLSCVFQQTRENTAHEVGHALALPHYFPEEEEYNYEKSLEERKSAGRTALVALSITTRSMFYQLHDNMNNQNACDFFDTIAPTTTVNSVTYTGTQNYFFYFNQDYYPEYKTDNLMDYRLGSGSSFKENLVKVQFDAVRYMTRSKRVVIKTL